MNPSLSQAQLIHRVVSIVSSAMDCQPVEVLGPGKHARVSWCRSIVLTLLYRQYHVHRALLGVAFNRHWDCQRHAERVVLDRVETEAAAAREFERVKRTVANQIPPQEATTAC